ncbi:MAG: hypothetical protein R3Y47_01140 [Lachnospiraceae bacterium]
MVGLEFRQIRDFSSGTLYRLLADAYSFDERCLELWEADWKEFDNFFYGNLSIADTCGFITMLDGDPIGMASWDPRKLPEYVEIGHNCIITKYKGNRYGKGNFKRQLIELRITTESKKS